MNLRTRLISLGIILTAIPLLLITIVVFNQNRRIFTTSVAVGDKLGTERLDDIVRNVERMCAIEYSHNKDAANTEVLKQQISRIQIGESGYVYIIKISGEERGHYLVSKDRLRDGEDIWDSRDTNGNYFIRQMCRKAVQLSEGEVGEERYPWINQGETKARMKVARLGYFQAWDWLIGAGAYEDEFNEEARQLSKINQQSQTLIMLVLGLALFLSILIWFIIANSLTNRIIRITHELAESSEQTSAAGRQVSSASQSLASDANTQASAIEEISSNLEELTAKTKRNSAGAEEAQQIAKTTSEKASHGMLNMEKLSTAVSEIKQSSDETAKIVKTIDDVAFQTNMLALNAAVEAARAGEAGKGFAVVAEEVRNLAQRSAEAAKNTANLISEAGKKTENGVQIAQQVYSSFKDINESAQSVNHLVAMIVNSSREQVDGIQQMNSAMTQVDSSTQNMASTAEEASSTSEELNSQVEMLREVVRVLTNVVGRQEKQNGRFWSKVKTIWNEKANEADDHFAQYRLKRKQLETNLSLLKSKEDKTKKKTESQGGSAKLPVNPEEVIPFEQNEGNDNEVLSKF